MSFLKNNKQGFSLIEVIVAVAILAVLSMPILLYFTRSAVQSANGRHEQAADAAAQSVVEEIDSIIDFQRFENELVASGSAVWTIVSGPAANINETTVLERPISIDYDGYGTKNYIARATVDYNSYKASSDANKTARYNNYNNPHLSEVYNDKNVLISEADESEAGFYAVYNTVIGSSSLSASTTTFDQVKAGAKRDFELSVKPVVGEADNCYVKGGYKFTFIDDSGMSHVVHVVIKEVKVAIADLSNIYFLFKPMDVTSGNPSNDCKATIDIDGVPGSQLSLSFIRQKSTVFGTAPLPVSGPAATEIISVDGDYDLSNKVTIEVESSSGEWQNATIFANANVEFTNAREFYKKTDELKNQVNHKRADGVMDDDGNLWMVSSPNDKRIAKITVSVYQKDSVSGGPSGKPLATAITSKSI